MNPYKNSSLLKRVSYAIHGIVGVWKNEKSFRFECLCGGAMLIFCIVTRPPLFWCAIFLGISALVLSLEIVNSAMETVLDKLHPSHDEKIGFAKDCLAGAVLIAGASAILIFITYIALQYTQ